MFSQKVATARVLLENSKDVTARTGFQESSRKLRDLHNTIARTINKDDLFKKLDNNQSEKPLAKQLRKFDKNVNRLTQSALSAKPDANSITQASAALTALTPDIVTNAKPLVEKVADPTVRKLVTDHVNQLAAQVNELCKLGQQTAQKPDDKNSVDRLRDLSLKLKAQNALLANTLNPSPTTE